MPSRLATRLCLLLLAPTLAAASAQQVRPTPNGAVLTAAGTTLELTALREDVIRVRAWQGSTPPEDASWAVLPAARTARAAVTPTTNGFTTPRLRVAWDAQLRLTVSDSEGHILQQDAAPVTWQGSRVTLTKQRTDADHFFGLGDKPGPLDRRGEAFTLWNTDEFGWQESTDPIYKSIPFFLNVRLGRTLGVFLDNTFRTNFDFGRASRDRYTLSAEDGPVDTYLLYGPEPKQVLAAWAWLTGPTPLPPAWALGFQQSRYTYFPESQFREIATRLRADRIPTDVLWLDIDFQHQNWPFTVDEQNYPDFGKLIADLKQDHFHTVVITDLHVARQPNVGYAPYDTGTAGDHFLHRADGSVYSGIVWPGAAVFPEFTRAQSRAWWGQQFKGFIAQGVAGFWNDMNEPAVFDTPGKTMPPDVRHRIEEPGFRTRTATHAEIHNLYGMQNARGTWEGQLALRPTERPFVMTRASYAGGQRFGATWTGDNSSTWNHLRQTVPQLLNLGLSGFSLAGADVGGFAGSPSPALLTRWVELAAFQPIDRIHSAKGTRMHEVWVDGPEHEAIRRRFIEERYRLLPYLYTAAEQGSRTGLPIDRPVFLEFPHATADGTPFDLTAGGTEFLFGPSLLVAPPPYLEDEFPYTVALPPGTWYDYWTNTQTIRPQPGAAVDQEDRDKVVALKPLKLTPRLDALPVYVRGGTILPIAPLTQSTMEIPTGPLTLRIYAPAAGEPCTGDVYTDDLHTLDYTRNAYARIHFACTLGTDGSLTLTIGAQEGKWKPWWSTYQVEAVGWTPAARTATLNGKAVTVASGEGRTAVTIPAASTAITLVLR